MDNFLRKVVFQPSFLKGYVSYRVAGKYIFIHGSFSSQLYYFIEVYTLKTLKVGACTRWFPTIVINGVMGPL